MSEIRRGSMSVEAMLVMSVLFVALGIILVLFQRGFLLAKIEAQDCYAEVFLEKIEDLRYEQLMKLGK
ncbi:MAG: hypothetical protein GX260_03905 [Tissierellia bacterium]|nr:hypothetical protein [Bacillota bacterium]NLL22908.1 hypothetical protein [Tissierellia bacterium]